MANWRLFVFFSSLNVSKVTAILGVKLSWTSQKKPLSRQLNRIHTIIHDKLKSDMIQVVGGCLMKGHFCPDAPNKSHNDNIVQRSSPSSGQDGMSFHKQVLKKCPWKVETHITTVKTAAVQLCVCFFFLI